MPTTITTARDAIFSILNADATFKGYLTGVGGGLVIFPDEAPQTALPLYCVLGVQSPGVDTTGAAGWRVLTNPLVKVVICGPQSSMAAIEAAYARADALLQPNGQPTRNTNGTLAIYRDSPVYLPDPQIVNSEPWVQYGGVYRVIL